VAEFPELNSGEVKIAKQIIPRLMEKFDVYGYVHRRAVVRHRDACRLPQG